MITLGMDPHPGSHTVAALDCNASLLGIVDVVNTLVGLEQLHQFASQLPLVAGPCKALATASWLSLSTSC